MEKSRIRTIKWWQFHHALWRYKFLVIFLVTVGTAISVLVTWRIPKQYLATAKDMVDSFSNVNNQDFNGVSTDLSRAHKILAESRPVHQKLVSLSGLTEEECKGASFDARVDGVLIFFNVTDGNYDVAKRLANAWAAAFIQEIDFRAKTGTELLGKYLGKQYDEDHRQWVDASNEIAKFYKNTGFSSTHFETDPIHVTVSANKQKLQTAQEQLDKLDVELRFINDKSNKAGALVQLPDVAGDKTFLDRLQYVRDCEKSLAEIRAKYRKGDEWKLAEDQLVEANLLLDQAREEVASALTLKRKVIENEIAKASTSYTESKTQLDDLMKHQGEYNALTSKIESARRNMDKVNDQLHEASMLKVNNRIAVINWEEAPDLDKPEPFKPNWRQNVSLGIIVSILLAGALVFGLEQIDDTVHTPHDLEQRIGAIVLGAVPACGRGSMDRDGYFLAKNQSASSAVDSMRGIHIGLEVGRKPAAHAGALVITITSAVPQDGKSFVTSNLGILFASLGRKVLVVDADLRKASLSKALGAENRDGFFEIVKNQKWIREYAVNGKTPGYYLLAAGHIRDSISESLHPESVSKLLEVMRKEFDVIIFDTPPVLALPDACVLGQLSDVTVLVTRSRHTRLAQAERAAATLVSAKVKDLVFVVNGLAAADAQSETYGYGYGYGSSSGYGYGYGYGAGYGREKGSKAHSKLKPVASNGTHDEDDDVDEEDDERSA